MTLERIEMPNADPEFVRALAALAEQELRARAPG
jgi:protoheme ferro-lyase